MLQKAFFKVDVVDRIYDTPLFEKTTPGAYEFTVPEDLYERYNYISIEYSGAGGGSNASYLGGGGSIKKIITSNVFYINGIVGATTDSITGGVGFSNGGNGKVSVGGGYGWGGGGSTSVVVEGTTNEASGGGGASIPGAPSGKGGGQFGGVGNTSNSGGNGKNATDPKQIGLNQGNGYVKIWAGYDPYFKG